MQKKLPNKLPELSIVVPVFNESEGLEHFNKTLLAVLNENKWSYEIIYVDDGSSDNSEAVIAKIATTYAAIKPVYLSRNFGKESATTAGIHASVGKAVVILDSDGQHPVEMMPTFYKAWKKGSKVIIGVRTSNQKEGFIKRYGSKMFYRMLRVLGVVNIKPGITDFMLVDRQVVQQFKKLKEHSRITRALIDWLGFKKEYIEFAANAREFGTATYSNKKLVQLALNGFVSMSFTPLYLSGYIGILFTLLSFIGGVFAIVEKYLLADPLGLNISGATIVAVFTIFLVGILLIGQGLVAIYIARIYIEVQDRPLYVRRN